NVDVNTRVLSVPTDNPSVHPNHDGLVPGDDTIHGDGGDDIIFGDHGVIDQAMGTLRILTTGDVTRIATVRPEVGGIDTIRGNSGADHILGGFGGDFLHGDAGNDIVLGDHGVID